MTDLEFTQLVNQHGMTFGYGRMMQIIADEWAKRNQIAALTVGPCKHFIDKYGDYHTMLEKLEGKKLSVWYGSMPESNGRTNWTAILHHGDMTEGHTIDRSQYPGRVRYAADRVRWLIGELDKPPHILDYDGDECTPCHLCGGSGVKDGKPCYGLNFEGTVHHVPPAKIS